MSKSPVFGRFSRYRDDSPSVASRDGPAHSTMYQLDDLPPSPSSASPSENLLRQPDGSSHASPPRGGAGQSRTFLGSSDDLSSRPPDEAPLFGGPPPPIARSILVSGDRRRRKSAGAAASKVFRDGLSTIKSVMFDPQPTTYEPDVAHGRDSVWRGLVRRESAIESELQQLLDMQALGLNSGSAAPVPMGASEYGDDGDARSTGSNTPTGTWYSSRSQMIASINPVTRSTATGEVLPVRQPRQQRQRPGLRAARSGLAHSISSLASLKAEEDGHVMGALAQRQTALGRLSALASRKEHIAHELEAIVKDDDEPLSAEIAQVMTQKADVDAQTKELEQQLEKLRLRSKQLEEAYDELNSRREAGLSGFKGALREVEKELGSILLAPPVAPLDPELLRQAAQPQSGSDTPTQASSEGAEVMRMAPKRRTPNMVRSWWESEIAILEKKQVAVRKEKEALDAGARMWRNVTETVATFEQDLKKEVERVMAEGGDPEEASSRQLPRMREVIQFLQNSLNVAQEKRWTLLICAIGAELEAFTKAESTLRASLGMDDKTDRDVASPQGSMLLEQDRNDVSRDASRDPLRNRSDSQGSNAVPQDLLTSTHERPYSPPRPSLARTDSENEVPPSLLMEQTSEPEG